LFQTLLANGQKIPKVFSLGSLYIDSDLWVTSIPHSKPDQLAGTVNSAKGIACVLPELPRFKCFVPDQQLRQPLVRAAKPPRVEYFHGAGTKKILKGRSFQRCSLASISNSVFFLMCSPDLISQSSITATLLFICGVYNGNLDACPRLTIASIAVPPCF